MVYLNIEKKVWAIGNKEYKVIENTSMKDLKWFKSAYKDIVKKNEDGTLTQSDALEFDEEWWDRLCKVGLKSTVEDVQDSNCTEKQFREFMAELYHFLSIITTLEEAKLSALYDPKIQKKENEQ